LANSRIVINYQNRWSRALRRGGGSGHFKIELHTPGFSFYWLRLFALKPPQPIRLLLPQPAFSVKRASPGTDASEGFLPHFSMTCLPVGVGGHLEC
jgi:hypothetical protein